ncbi:MAG: xylose isomerase, partial [Bacteroidota bacterium]
MQRRTALKCTASLPLLAIGPSARAMSAASTNLGVNKFNLSFAPHDGMFKAHAGDNILDQIQWAADQGFTAWEDNGMPKRSPEMQSKIGNLLAKNDMQ